MRTVKVFDTTLRDGEQTPGISFPLSYKIQIAKQLDKLGVDIIEAGFPAATQGEFDAVKEIASLGLDSKVCGLARLVKHDIDRAIQADVDMVHIFISTSKIQIEHTVKKSREEIVEMAVEGVEYIKSHGVECMFSAMDATRTEVEYLKTIYKAVEEAGVDIVNVPDTVGVATPFTMYELIRELREHLKVPIDVHCHNDFGLAVANTYAAVKAGADEVQVTVNGIGERAGNASLAEVVMLITAVEGLKTNIKTEYLVETARLVERLSGIKLPPNTPIVGENAFSHESGIHAHGVLSEAATFEPGLITPEMVGHRRRIVIGKHAGRHQIKKMLEDAGYAVSEDILTKIVEKVKELGDKGKKVTDLDVITLAEVLMGEVRKEERAIILDEATVLTGNRITPTAVINAEVDGKKRVTSAIGVGPVDAALKAVAELVGKSIRITEFRMDAITGGSDALAEVYVTVEDEDGRSFTARGAGADIVMASIDAVINAVNYLMKMRKNR
ncbi:isopropylmalate/citramalate/homocitrate synthase [Geoglobus ahangari]|uniref:2-isopropylmalate synthase n=1 Tax=Geoglobus ahangari TaxID=113653 RepID=A0A0F7IEK2_9EURY|nr:2-isopropylmalate synthase [Geoglobus ahangari]AKG91415.1 isopropylmalate/citramalate/homocitrate synthase [Geoglobus ahangari]